MNDKCYSCGTINPSLSVCDDCNMKLVEGVNKLQAERDSLQKRVEELEELFRLEHSGQTISNDGFRRINELVKLIKESPDEG